MNVAKIIVFDAERHVLLLRRSDTHPVWPLHWDIPGGVVEPGEDPTDGAIRELREETGISTTSDQLNLAQITHSRTHYLNDHLYVLQLDESMPDVTISWEHDKAEWMNIESALAIKQTGYVDEYFTLAVEYLRSVLK